MAVELRLMRYVVAVADAGGFQRAARELRIAQPSLSRQIRDLEQRLGTPLFDRRPTQLTEAGRLFVDAARRVLADTDQMVARTRQAGKLPSGTVRVGYTVSAAYRDMPRLAEAMAERYPDVAVPAREVWGNQLAEDLVAGRLDAGLGRALPIPDGFAAEVLYREPMAVVVNAAHRLADRDRVSLADLRGETLRFFSRALAPTYYDFVVRALGRAFPVWESPTPGLRHLSLRDHPDGFTVLPVSVAGLLPAGVVALDLADPPVIDTQLVWRPDDAPPAVHRLVATARAVCT